MGLRIKKVLIFWGLTGKSKVVWGGGGGGGVTKNQYIDRNCLKRRAWTVCGCSLIAAYLLKYHVNILMGYMK